MAATLGVPQHRGRSLSMQFGVDETTGQQTVTGARNLAARFEALCLEVATHNPLPTTSETVLAFRKKAAKVKKADPDEFFQKQFKAIQKAIREVWSPQVSLMVLFVTFFFLCSPCNSFTTTAAMF
jgi:hypothetical protein